MGFFNIIFKSSDVLIQSWERGCSFVMEGSSESPRVPPGIGWGFTSFLCPRGRAFAIHLCPGVGAFATDINSRNFQMLTIFIFISSSTFYSKVLPFIELVFEKQGPIFYCFVSIVILFLLLFSIRNGVWSFL